MENKLGFKENKYGNFPGSPVAKISPSNPEGLGLIPGQGAKIPHASGLRNQNIQQKKWVTNSMKTLKMVHIQKKI